MKFRNAMEETGAERSDEDPTPDEATQQGRQLVNQAVRIIEHVSVRVRMRLRNAVQGRASFAGFRVRYAYNLQELEDKSDLAEAYMTKTFFGGLAESFEVDLREQSEIFCACKQSRSRG